MRRVGVRPSFGQERRSRILAAALCGAAFACAPAQAQDNAAAIEARIAGVFSIVPGNPLDLAVPLTRRALARRMADRDTPLPYVDAGVPVSAEGIAARPDTPEIEEGSAEAGDEDADVARLPRPRPDATADAAAASVEAALLPDSTGGAATGIGGPLELVAGAAGPLPPEPAPTSEPQQLLPGEPAEIVVAAARLQAGAPQELAAATPPAAPAAAELVAREGCLALSKLADKDGDFERNADLLSAPGICLTQQKFRERRRPWIVQTVSSGRPGPLWAVMHDDEDLAFDTALRALGAHGGTLVAVETGGRRNLDGIDPNRNFSDEEIGCKKLGKNATPRFSAAFRALFDPAHPVIALHNNSDGRVPTGGLGHVSMQAVPKNMRKAPSSDAGSPLAGDRALVLLAAADPVPATIETRVETLNGKGINVVLEPVRKDRGDCSFSNYAVLSGQENYFNVTVDHDEGEKLQKIVDAILADPAAVAASQ